MIILHLILSLAIPKCIDIKDQIHVNIIYGETPQYYHVRNKSMPWIPSFLIAKYGLTIDIDNQGFIDFSSFAVKKCRIRMTGDRNLDKEEANRTVFYTPYKPESYKKYVWHHSQDGTTMFLIPKEIHELFPHRGGLYYIKRRMYE